MLENSDVSKILTEAYSNTTPYNQHPRAVKPSIATKPTCEEIGLQIPKVKLLDKVEYHDSYYNGYGASISAPTLVAFAEAKGYRPFDMPLACVVLDTKCWGTLTDFKDFLVHYTRCTKANLDYPILLDVNGFICDGWHRVARAIIEGRATIKAIRLEEMPEGFELVATKKD